MIMQILVVGAMLLFVASFLYPPLGRALRDLGRKAEDNRGSRAREFKSAPEPSSQTTGAQEARPQFGKRVTVEGPKRPSTPPEGQIFNKELFEGERGEFLRKMGYSPDDPRNQAVNTQPLSVLLAEDLAGLRRATTAVNGVSNFRIEPWHLLPFEIWRDDFGPWLRKELDLSPARPWNTIFLPADEAGATALGLPIAPQPLTPTDETMAMLAILRETYAGHSPQEGEAVRIMLDGVRSNTPQLFPADIGDFSDRVRTARAHVRALAFVTAVTSGAIGKDAIVKSQATFLGKPDEQLVG